MLAFVALFLIAFADIAHHIIRFEDANEEIHYGQFLGGNKAQLIDGDVFGERRLTNQVKTIKKLLAPIPQPDSIVGIGLNYWGHINSSGMVPPKTPSIFFKHYNSFNHPYKPVNIPDWSSEPDYEGELGVILSKTCKDVSEADALDCVLGYTVCHDVSARCLQNDKGSCPGNGGQFSFSKSLDSHCPLGPVIVSKDVLGDGSDLWLTTRVNSEVRQNQTTSTLVFGVKKIVSFMTKGTTYAKGTVICTGTPDGVGDTMKPPVYLQDKDSVAITIDKIGTLVNPINRPMEHPEVFDDHIPSHDYVETDFQRTEKISETNNMASVTEERMFIPFLIASGVAAFSCFGHGFRWRKSSEDKYYLQ